MRDKTPKAPKLPAFTPWTRLENGTLLLRLDSDPTLEGAVRLGGRRVSKITGVEEDFFIAWIDQTVTVLGHAPGTAQGTRHPYWTGTNYRTLTQAKIACRSAFAWDARRRSLGIGRGVKLIRAVDLRAEA